MLKLLHKNWVLLAILLLAMFLRLYELKTNPVSLFGDELDLGYHAYSIFKTGRDYQGNYFPIHFHSLAEWRTPLYLYAAVPSVFLFGITPLGVRLPAAIFGVLGILGIYLLVKEIADHSGIKQKRVKIEYLAALITTFSPWHLQYSRAGFEVTMLLAFLVFGLYFFLRSIRNNGNLLWLSAVLLTFTPWIYSTAKLFTPVLIIFLVIFWKSDIFTLPKKSLVYALLAGLLVGLPIVYGTIWGGGAQRAGYTSIFTDPTVVPEVGTDRTRDYLMRGDLVLNAVPTVYDRLYHNKFTEWGKAASANFFKSFSADFLFVNGDPNLRHSPDGVGQLYKIEAIALLVGIVMFFAAGTINKRIKFLIFFWLVLGALPAALTRDGGNHATRLILILPPIVFLVSYGLSTMFTKPAVLGVYTFVWVIEIAFYMHLYYVHYPWDSERWWHSGFREAITEVKSIDTDFDKVIISMAGEPAWIFFAGWYEYPPSMWQAENPIGNDTYVEGFGKISHTGKFYFGAFNEPGKGIYDLGNYIDKKTLYVAVAKEIGANLIIEPERTPNNLNLEKAVAYPSGEPAFYLFSGTK